MKPVPRRTMDPAVTPKIFREYFVDRSNPEKLEELIRVLSNAHSTLQETNFSQIPYDLWTQLRPLTREVGSCLTLLNKCHQTWQESGDPPQWTEEKEEVYQTILSYINNTPELLSLLYDLNLLPESVVKFGREWSQMLNVAQHFHTFQTRIQKQNSQKE